MSCNVILSNKKHQCHLKPHLCQFKTYVVVHVLPFSGGICFIRIDVGWAQMGEGDGATIAHPRAGCVCSLKSYKLSPLDFFFHIHQLSVWQDKKEMNNMRISGW